MAIENRDLKPGMKLVARFKKQDYSAEVVTTDEGLRIKLADGKVFKSVSAAGSHVMGGTACNGWRFWSIEGQSETQAPYETGKPKPTKPVKKPAGKGVKPAAKTAKAPAKKTAVTSVEGEKAPEPAPVAPGSPDGDSLAQVEGL